ALERFTVHGASGFPGVDNLKFWQSARVDTTVVLINDADPLHAKWGKLYGPRSSGSPSMPAKFAMTAVAIDQASSLEAGESVAFTLIATGAAAFVGGAASTTLLLVEPAAE